MRYFIICFTSSLKETFGCNATIGIHNVDAHVSSFIMLILASFLCLNIICAQFVDFFPQVEFHNYKICLLYGEVSIMFKLSCSNKGILPHPQTIFPKAPFAPICKTSRNIIVFNLVRH